MREPHGGYRLARWWSLSWRWCGEGSNPRTGFRTRIRMPACDMSVVGNGCPVDDVYTMHGEAPVVRESPGHLEARLDPGTFFRIHRSAIVNIRHVRELRTLSHGDCELWLSHGQKLKLSRTRREEFEHVLETGER